ncbi:MAG: hypothetical protein IJV35_04695 [Neisseriaceae bacterium]|nr:hypothetical protein [Neisseriaceae bacterium]
MYEDDYWFNKKEQKKFNIIKCYEKNLKIDNIIDYLSYSIVIMFFIGLIVYYLIIYHFNLLDFINYSIVDTLVPNMFIPKLLETESYEKSILLGFCFFVSLVFYFTILFVIVFTNCILYDGDPFLKPRLVRRERKKEKYKRNGKKQKINYELPDENSFKQSVKALFSETDVHNYYFRKNIKRPFFRWLFCILLSLFLWVIIWIIHKGFFIESFQSKFEQLLMWSFTPLIFSGGVGVFVAVCLYGLFFNFDCNE